MTMVIQIKATTALEMVEQLGKFLEVKIEQDCQRYGLNLPKRFGSGEIYSYSINEGLDIFVINANFAQDWSIQLTRNKLPPISFMTLGGGTFFFVDQRDKANNYILEPLQSCIQTQDTEADFHWQFAGGQDLSFSCIMIHKEAFFADIDCGTLEIPEELVEVAMDLKGQNNFVFQEIFHLPIISALNEITGSEDAGLINSTFAAAKTYEMLFLQLEAYKTAKNSDGKTVVKPDTGIVNVRNAEQILMTRLQEPPTIVELSKMVGINQQTLKKGFKQLYGQTINQYLNDKRLEQAAILMKIGNLQLKEIALEVGYSNPSYFTRRFKEKYGVSPRNFQLKSNPDESIIELA